MTVSLAGLPGSFSRLTASNSARAPNQSQQGSADVLSIGLIFSSWLSKLLSIGLVSPLLGRGLHERVLDKLENDGPVPTGFVLFLAEA